jgi:predicted lipid carrier protein YhbT
LPRPKALGAYRHHAPTLSAAAFSVAARPVSLALTHALRRAAHRDPAAFERLGRFRSATYLIEPEEAPLAFRLEPDGARGRVTLVRRDCSGAAAARVRGPMAELLALLDGSLDADAAFFGRALVVDGSTEALVALHNGLEAADLSLADLLPFPAVARRGLRRVLRRARGRGGKAA